jgi:hypothetical protein
MTQFKEATLQTIADGKAIEQVNFELKRVLENCTDPNTAAKVTRIVTLKIKITPSEDRKRAEIAFQAESKIAPDAAGSDQLYFGQGGVFVSSAKQLTFDDYEETVTELESEQEASND